MKSKLFLLAAAGLLINSAESSERSSASSFLPPFRQEKTSAAKSNAKPYVDAKNSAFIFGNKRIVFSGPGNFTIFSGERKVAVQYIVFSSPYSNWVSTKNLGTETVKQYSGGSVCITKREFDTAANSFVMEGLYPCHPKGSDASKYKVQSWSQTARILPDGKLEIVFVNHADDAFMQSRPRHILNSFFFDLAPGMTFENSQPRIKEKGLKKSWMYYSFKILSGKEAVCQAAVDMPSLFHPYKDTAGFYYNSPECKEQRFIFDFLKKGEGGKKAAAQANGKD